MTVAQTYQERMSNLNQFRRLGIGPLWKPGTGDIDGFCHDEVVRQYHDPRVRADGGVRVDWMLNAWVYAQMRAKDARPTLTDILALGMLVEPKMNALGVRDMNVYIGDRMGADPRKIRDCLYLLERAVKQVDPLKCERSERGWHPDQMMLDEFDQACDAIETADDWYLAYEWIHPFGDGNGRTGKILHNWLLGTLDEPELVADWFGGGNP